MLEPVITIADYFIAALLGAFFGTALFIALVVSLRCVLNVLVGFCLVILATGEGSAQGSNAAERQDIWDVVNEVSAASTAIETSIQNGTTATVTELGNINSFLQVSITAEQNIQFYTDQIATNTAGLLAKATLAETRDGVRNGILEEISDNTYNLLSGISVSQSQIIGELQYGNNTLSQILLANAQADAANQLSQAAILQAQLDTAEDAAASAQISAGILTDILTDSGLTQANTYALLSNSIAAETARAIADAERSDQLEDILIANNLTAAEVHSVLLEQASANAAASAAEATRDGQMLELLDAVLWSNGTSVIDVMRNDIYHMHVKANTRNALLTEMELAMDQVALDTGNIHLATLANGDILGSIPGLLSSGLIKADDALSVLESIDLGTVATATELTSICQKLADLNTTASSQLTATLQLEATLQSALTDIENAITTGDQLQGFRDLARDLILEDIKIALQNQATINGSGFDGIETAVINVGSDITNNITNLTEVVNNNHQVINNALNILNLNVQAGNDDQADILSEIQGWRGDDAQNWEDLLYCLQQIKEDTSELTPDPEAGEVALADKQIPAPGNPREFDAVMEDGAPGIEDAVLDGVDDHQAAVEGLVDVERTVTELQGLSAPDGDLPEISMLTYGDGKVAEVGWSFSDQVLPPLRPGFTAYIMVTLLLTTSTLTSKILSA